MCNYSQPLPGGKGEWMNFILRMESCLALFAASFHSYIPRLIQLIMAIDYMKTKDRLPS